MTAPKERMRMTHREWFDSARERGPGRVARATLLLLALLTVPAIAAEPVRVATLLPYVEDALVRTGGVEIVATVRRDMSTAPASPIIDLGSPHAPSFEKLAEARPQVIVGDRQLHGALRDKLARSGADVVLVGSDTVDTPFDGPHEGGPRRRGEQALGRAVQ